MKVNTRAFFPACHSNARATTEFVPFLEEVTVGYRDKPQDSWRQSTLAPHCKMDLMKKKKSIISVENRASGG